MRRQNFPYLGRSENGMRAPSWSMPLLLMAMVAGLLGPLAGTVAGLGPETGTFFRYDYHQNVDAGSGQYYGYTDQTLGTAHYWVTGRNATEIQMSAVIITDYSNSESKSEHSHLDSKFAFSPTTRHYTTTDIDDPDYEGMDGHTLCVWFWVPTTIGTGDKVCILDDEGTVISTSATLWSKNVPRHNLILVSLSGTGSRNDDYGQMTIHFTDNLYYDKSTGMFVAERYEETDSGTWKGMYAYFGYHIQIDVTSANYEFDTDWAMVAAITLVVILVVLGTAFLIYRIRWRTKNVQVRDLFAMGVSRVKIRRIWKKEQFPRLPNSATSFFEPFLPHWVEKALASKDRVAVAVDPQYGLVGVAFYVKEGQIGTILCKHTELTEVLRAYIGCKDFFSEMMHSIQLTADMSQDPYLMAQLNQFGTQAFNVFETHNVYRLDQIRQTSYDADLVRPMREEDTLAVVELAQKVYRGKAQKWITGNLKAGDMGVVAVLDGRIVGFGFACMCGQFGRLHTLGVDAAYRGRGIAKELHRARLEAMRLMGVTTVIDEIADWNLPSIRISTLSGFQSIGKMYVETVRKKRIKKDIVRR